MSDAKRPGNRDISDLKQRLGLKKGAAPAGQATTPATNGRQTGGVVPPPGMNLPPPPGVQQTQPAPVIPNAAEDPFAAMNAMAAVGTVQRAPEIVIVNDGKPVENVGASGAGATIAKVAIPAVAALIVGVAVGKIGEAASNYNEGLENAKIILGDRNKQHSIAGLKQTISQIDTLLDGARRNQFRPDKKVDDELRKLSAKLEVKSDIVFRAKQNTLDAAVSGQILSFFSGVSEVKSMIDAHLASARSDDKAFANAAANVDKATLKPMENAYLAASQQLRYGALITAPTEEDPGADFGVRIVEIGGVACGTSNAQVPQCPDGESPSGIYYRVEPGGNFIKGDLASPSTDSVPTKKLVQLVSSGTRDSLIKGAEGMASEAFYQKRLRAIFERICKRGQDDKCLSETLLDSGNRLETRMQAETKKGKRFSFFL